MTETIVLNGSKPQAACQTISDRSIHREQYDDNMASFFEMFNQLTGRRELYQGYLTGCLSQKRSMQSKTKQIAVDFGCGTGWLTRLLPQLGYGRVYGIDTSMSMLRLAFDGTARELTTSGQIRYMPEVPRDIVGQCNLVTAVHVHYHFVPYEQLKTNFFGNISSLLKEGGEAIIIGCPSDFIRKTPYHYQNNIHLSDIPPEVLKKASDPTFLADEDGYIPLSDLPEFKIQDGIQMKVSLKAIEPNGTAHLQRLTDTYWSDKALENAAAESGLHLVNQQNLSSGGHMNAYMAMHFRKNSNKIHHP